MTILLEVEHLFVDLALPAGTLHAVRDVSFKVEKGKTLSLVGESGCGKSMTAMAVMGLLPPSASCRAAKIELEGENLQGLSENRMATYRGARMAMIFQEPMTSLDPCYSIGNQLVEALTEHQNVSVTEAEERAVYLLEKVGITGAGSRLKQYPHQLSGGLRQRIMIAMGLMCGPSLIIADEPTTALDVTIQAQILKLLSSIQKEFNMGMILITHDLGVVARVADDVVVMYCGEVVETGNIDEIFTNPIHPYTKGLLECIPVPGKTEPGKKLGSIPGIVPTPIGELWGCSFRNRCRSAVPECADKGLKLTQISDKRSFRCVRPGFSGDIKVGASGGTGAG
ncbi:ABC transporter ATP-binding protein [Desulfomarina profundi]|uniref:ABC transporter ATP-binding protein n=1 Tax=Desulfomarina profundi TaxID=2772557 RepID=A0A8D5JMY0_9BACT|nr:ABC transporter ATP-binding protein [Desulfomarina profundi]BCL62092.1 ABC transporter ATP-binding protein [Desulfomarina profundi]